MRRIFRASLSLLRWLARFVFVLALALTVAVMVLTRTDWGHRRVIAFALPRLGRTMTGAIRVGRLDGNLLRRLVLTDVEIDDAEGQPAIQARHVEARIHLAALLRRVLEIDELRIDNGRVYERRLRDGSVNLATLLRRSSSTGRATAIVIRRAVATLAVRGEPVLANQIGATSGQLFVDGSARILGDSVKVQVDHLAAQIEGPARVWIVLHGGLRSDGKSVALDPTDAELATTAAELNRLWPASQMRGSLRARAHAEGPLDDLHVHLALMPETGRVDVNGSVGIDRAHRRWQLRAHANGLDPGALWSGLPRGATHFDAASSGADGRGSVRIEELHGESKSGSLDGRGQIDLDGNGDATIALHVGDLRQLAPLRSPFRTGRLEAAVHLVRTRKHLTLDLDAHGARVALPSLSATRLDAHLHSVDWLGALDVRANGASVAGRPIGSVRVSARGDRHGFLLHAGAGERTRGIVIDLHGRPRWRDARPVGADAIVDRLSVRANGQRWQTTKPARLTLLPSQSHVIVLDEITLRSRRQQLSLDGRLTLADRSFEARLRGRDLDLAAVANLIRPSEKLPHTRIDLAARAYGKVSSPVVIGQLAGTIEPSPGIGLERTRVQLKADYCERRAIGDLTASSGPASVRAHVDVATASSIAAPLRVVLNVEGIPLAKLKPLLPSSLANLDGTAKLDATASGSLRSPTLRAQASVSGLRAGAGTPSSATLSVDWRDAALALDGAVKLGGGGGELVADAQVTLDAARALASPANALLELRERAPITLTATARHLSIERLPIALPSGSWSVDGGILDASATLHGSLRRPETEIHVRASDLRRGEKFHKLGAELSLSTDGESLKLRGAVELGGQHLLDAEGESRIDPARVAEARKWLNSPLDVHVKVPGFDLARLTAVRADLPTLTGRVQATAEIGGTVAAPTGNGEFSIASASIGGVNFPRASGRVRFDGARVAAKWTATQAPSGSLSLDADVPIDLAQPLHLTAKATHFDLAFLPSLVPELGAARGTLDAHLTASGTRARPILDGAADVSLSLVRLREAPYEYRDVSLNAAIHGGKLTLSRLHATAGDGSLDAHGDATLDGLRLTRVDGAATARKFSLLVGSVAGWLDAELKLHGETVDHALRGSVEVVSGGVRLPKIAEGRNLQPLGALEDVVYDDEAARHDAKRAAAATASSTAAHLVAHLPGPFFVRSSEADTELRGDLDLDVHGRSVALRGHLAATGGWIEIIGRRYEIDHARVGFTGPPDNPDLDVRLTRLVGATTIAVEVHGTARKPELRFSSDPPQYDQSQIEGLMASGDPSAPGVSSRTLDQQLSGAVSSALFGRLKSAVAPSLPLDVFNVDANTEGLAGLGQTRLELGKYLTDKIYVSYVHQFGAPVGITAVNSNEARVEYRFHRGFEIDSSYGDAGVGGIDLYWTVRY